MKRLAVLTTMGALFAAGAGASAGPAAADASATAARACKDTQYATYIRSNRLNCGRARQVAQYWETYGHCPSGWRFKRAGDAPPNVGVGGSLLRCIKRGTKQYVTWVESGGGD